MVPKQEDHGGLLHLGEIVDQVPKGVVALLDEGQVLVHGGEPPGQHPGELRRPLQTVPGLVIAAVVLHGDVKEKERLSLFLLLVQTDQALIVGLVADVLPDKAGVGEVVLKQHRVEAEVGVYRPPVPAGGQIGV